MLRLLRALIALFSVLLVMTARAGADPDTLPMPRRLSIDEDWVFSEAELERTIAKLRTERDALSSEWSAMRKKNTPVTPTMADEQRLFQAHLQRALQHLQETRSKSPPRRTPAPQPVEKRIEPDDSEPKKPMPPAEKGAEPPKNVPANALAQAHALLRMQQYEDALASFQEINLKGKKAEERAPVQYLKGCCLLHLGRTKEATELFTEVANYRGDEILAGYAQWILEAMRWQRDVERRLQELRERRQALEKR